MITTIGAQRTERLFNLLEEAGSKDASAHINVINDINPTADKPYHNAQHCITVAIYSNENAKWLGFSRMDILAITLAGLYHDYNHISPDDNISRPLAVAGAREHISNIEGERRPNFLNDIGTMIEEARTPKRRKAPEYYPSRLVYDADHMQILEPDFLDFLAGLNKETARSVTYEAYVADLQKRKLFTTWAKEYALVRVLQPERFGLTA